jgi:hypothetical protein
LAAPPTNRTMSESSRPYQDAFDAYTKDLEQITSISDRLFASAEGVRNEPIKDTEKAEKLKTIRVQLEKLLHEGRAEARDRYDATIDAADAKGVQDIRGLCAYAEGTGQADAGIRYLLGECRAYDKAAGDYKLRRALRAQIVDVLGSVTEAVEKQKGIVRPDTSLLGEFESIQDPERATAFYNKNKDVILIQLQAR